VGMERSGKSVEWSHQTHSPFPRKINDASTLQLRQLQENLNKHKFDRGSVLKK
jgi:hypothetical protein